MVRKLGVLGHEELAMGAIATGGVTTFNTRLIHELHIDKVAIEQVIKLEKLGC